MASSVQHRPPHRNEVQNGQLKRKREEAFGFSNKKAKENIDPKNIDAALNVFKKHLYFHSTDYDSSSSIKEQGFKLTKKTDGCARLITDYRAHDVSAQAFHYFSKSYKEACWYARIRRDNEAEPVILRVLIPPSVRLEKDPHPTVYQSAFRTREAIDKVFVFRSTVSRDNLTEALKSFNVHINSAEAEELKTIIKTRVLRDDTQAIADAPSFVAEELERSNAQLRALAAQNGPLKEGESYSIALD